MKKIIVVLFFLPLLMAFSCEEDLPAEDIVCTTQFVYGLSITVKNAQTNQVLTQDVTVTAVDGNYSETLELIPEINNFVGAGERAGNYIITVSRPGFQTYISSVIQVSADVCHVIPQVRTINLQPL